MKKKPYTRLSKLSLNLLAALVLAIAFLAGSPQNQLAKAVSTLAPGDIAVIGFNMDDPDDFAFVTLVELDSGAQIRFTDDGWLSAGGFRAYEGGKTYTAPSAIPAGTVISLSGDASDFVDNNAGLGSGGFALAAGGDQIIAFQGEATSPNLIYALNDNGSAWQSNATDSNSSALPTGLTDGSTAVAVAELDNSIYTGITSGSREELLAAIGNPANWSGSDATPQAMPSGPFDVQTVEVGPYVVSAFPASGQSGVALEANLTVTFNENVTVSAGWYSLSCSLSGAHTAVESGGPRTFTLNPDAGFSIDDTCTVTIDKDLVADQDGLPPENMSSDYTWSFTTSDNCSGAATLIHDIQGSGTASSQDGNVHTIEGIVTADYQGSAQLKGFFVQEEDADADSDPATSEGIFVFSAANPVSVGDKVRVTGAVDEYSGLTELTSISEVQLCSSGSPQLPAQALSLPFPAAVGGVPYLERYEGMRVSLPANLYVTELYSLGRGGEFVVSANDRLWQPTNVVSPGTPANDLQASNDLNRILVDDDSIYTENPNFVMHPAPGLSLTNRVRVGDQTAAAISGVLNYSTSGWYNSTSAYHLHPDAAATFISQNPQPAALNNEGYLTIASANLLNYFNGDGSGGGFPAARGADTLAEFNNQRAKTIAALYSLDADVIGLMEMENDGYGLLSAIQDLVNGLNAVAGAGVYAFINSGGASFGSDQITVAIIYRPANVTPVGSVATLTTGSFDQSQTYKHRQPMAQTFQANLSGERFTVVVNHLKSKGCTGASGSNADLGDGQSCWNQLRTQGAQELVAWLATDPTASGDPDFVILGDINAYAKEDPLAYFTSHGYVDQSSGSGSYSYMYMGQTGSLDHMLTSISLDSQIADAFIYHINADEPPAFDYNDYNPAALYAADRFRAADHDPIVIRLAWPEDAYADQGGICPGKPVECPCFTSIQEAIEYVPPTSSVFVYTGTYSEAVTLSRDITVNSLGSYTVTHFTQSLGVFNAPTGALTIGGNLMHIAGTFNHNNGTVVLAGPNAQTLGSAASFFDLTINNSQVSGDGVSLGSDVTVEHLLTLNDGFLTLGSHHLMLGADAAVAGAPSANSMVIAAGTGELRKQLASADPAPFTFPLGDNTGTAEYSPATLDFSAISGTGYVALRLDNTPHPANIALPRLSRFWTVKQSGLANFTCQATFTYTDADLLLGGNSEGELYAAQYNAGSWTVFNPVDEANNQLSATVTSFANETGSAFTGAPGSPTTDLLASLQAAPGPGQVYLTWQTNDVAGLLGFNVYRADTSDGVRQKLNTALLPADGSAQTGFIYHFTDRPAQPGIAFYYWIEVIQESGSPAWYGWVSAFSEYTLYLPLVFSQASPLAINSAWSSGGLGFSNN